MSLRQLIDKLNPVKGTNSSPKELSTAYGGEGSWFGYTPGARIIITIIDNGFMIQQFPEDGLVPNRVYAVLDFEQLTRTLEEIVLVYRVER
jgi:hypothetical protein